MKDSFKIIANTLLALTCAVFLSSTSHSEPVNLSLLKQEIKAYHDSGLYNKELEQVISKARGYIIKEATLNEQRGNPKKLALVLDIDETSLSNYNQILKRDFVGSRQRIHQEILAAGSPAISPMLALYNEAIKHNIRIFFVSGRTTSELKATQTNLLRAGFKNWTGIYLRPESYKYSSIIPFKRGARESIAKQGYTIVASIGDQCSDLTGGYMQKGFKLPNPFYYLP